MTNKQDHSESVIPDVVRDLESRVPELTGPINSGK